MSNRRAATLFMLLFCIGYLCAFAPGFPVLKYYPVAHTWSLRETHEGPAMKWFGKLLVAGVLGMVGALVGLVIEKRYRSKDDPRALVDYLAWALVFATLVVTAVRELVLWL